MKTKLLFSLLIATLSMSAVASDNTNSQRIAKNCFAKYANTKSGKVIRLSNANYLRFKSLSGSDMALLTAKTKSAHYRGNLSAVFEYDSRGKLNLLRMNVKRKSTYGNVSQNLGVTGPFKSVQCN